jgi:hypothetical protein
MIGKLVPASRNTAENVPYGRGGGTTSWQNGQFHHFPWFSLPLTSGCDKHPATGWQCG